VIVNGLRVGERRVLTPAEIVLRLREQGIDPEAHGWAWTRSVVITRRSRAISSAQLVAEGEAAIRRELHLQPGDEAVITAVAEPRPLLGPVGEVGFTTTLRRSALPGGLWTATVAVNSSGVTPSVGSGQAEALHTAGGQACGTQTQTGQAEGCGTRSGQAKACGTRSGQGEACGSQLGQAEGCGTRSDGAVIAECVIRYRVRVVGDVLVTRRPMARHEGLDTSNVAAERCEITGLRGEPIRTAQSVTGMRAARGVGPATVVTTEWLEEAPAVHKGDSLLVVSRVGPVIARSPVTALADGRVGEVIAARVGGDGSKLLVKVSGAGQGEVMVSP